MTEEKQISEEEQNSTFLDSFLQNYKQIHDEKGFEAARAFIADTKLKLQSENSSEIIQRDFFPEMTIRPNDKITHLVLTNKIKPTSLEDLQITGAPDGWTIVDLGEREKEFESIKAGVKLALENLPKSLKLPDHTSFTGWDNVVHVACCTFWKLGITSFTAAQIYKAFAAGNQNARTTDEIEENIHEAFLRLSTTVLKLNAGTAGNAYGVKDWTRVRHMITGGIDELKIYNQHGLQSVRLYTITEEPILLSFARVMNNQILTTRTELLNSPLHKTTDIIALHYVLMRNINGMGRGQNKTLTYETIFERANIKLPEDPQKRKNKAQRLRRNISEILDYFKAIGHIKDWKPIYKQRTAYGVKISIKRKKEPIEPPEQANTTPEQTNTTP